MADFPHVGQLVRLESSGVVFLSWVAWTLLLLMTERRKP